MCRPVARYLRQYVPRRITGLPKGPHWVARIRFQLWIFHVILRGTMSTPPPQFGTAEYVGVLGTELCQFCHQQIGTRYYRINNAMACPGCAERLQFELPKDSHSRYVRGLIFGIGAAVLGLILYATFEIVTGWIIGYVSLAVGYIVGKGINLGSRGAGGRKYQITAVVLTYAAVSLAAVPVIISYARSHRTQQSHREVQQQQTNSDSVEAQPSSEAPGSSRRPAMSFTEALLRLSLIGLASPFFELAENPVGGLIGLVILAVGIRIAWRLCAGTETQIYGPFENAVKAASSS
jgi:hypothetical protein